MFSSTQGTRTGVPLLHVYDAYFCLPYKAHILVSPFFFHTYWMWSKSCNSFFLSPTATVSQPEPVGSRYYGKRQETHSHHHHRQGFATHYSSTYGSRTAEGTVMHMAIQTFLVFCWKEKLIALLAKMPTTPLQACLVPPGRLGSRPRGRLFLQFGRVASLLLFLNRT